MVEKALEHEPQLKACDYEFRLPKPSYTWHTLQAISKDYPENEFTLLIGGDNWAAFDKWYHHDDILAHYPIVVYPRQGACIGNVPEGVTIVETPLLNISSTEIRKRIKRRKASGEWCRNASSNWLSETTGSSRHPSIRKRLKSYLNNKQQK